MSADRERRWPRVDWSEAVWSSQLRPPELLVALAYADHARDQPTAWVTNERLVERTRLSRRTVQDARKALIDAGWLVEETPAAQHRTAVYRLAIPGVHVLHPSESASGALVAPLAPSTRTGVQEVPSGVQEMHARGAGHAPNSSTTKGLTSAPRTSRDAETDGSTMTDRAEPTDEALALFSSSHPGRECEALRAALAYYERRHGKRCANPAAYFGSWNTDELSDKIRLPQTTDRCPDCNGEGWIYDDPAEPSSARKCAHPRRTA